MNAHSLCIMSETGRPVSNYTVDRFWAEMHNERSYMYITYIYSNTSLLVIFNQSTGLPTESIFSKRHHYSSMVVFFSLH